MQVNASTILRVVAVVAFAFAMFGYSPGSVQMVPLGLAAWCASTFC